jgi:kynurenine formamidase
MISSDATIIDLTHTISPTIPTWDGSSGFEQQTVIDYPDCTTKTKFRVQKICMVAGIGTHMDAPAHCIPGAQTIDKLALSALCVPCVVIDVRAQANDQYAINLHDIEQFERTYGHIPANSLVAFNTGWDTFWHDPRAYRNDHRFPSIAIEAAELLVKRAVTGVAIDTLGVDRPQDDYPVHQVLLGAGIYIVENATNLDKLPATGSYIFALPIKVADGTEAPLRCIGIIL